MWDCNSWCRSCFINKRPSDCPFLLAAPQPDTQVVCFNCISFSAIARMMASWLNHRRLRYLVLILCSPFLIPLFFATCPLICAVEICCFLCRKRRKIIDGGGDGEDGEDRGGLLQRYLEDQLLLVMGSLDGDGLDGNVTEEDRVYERYFDSARPLLQ